MINHKTANCKWLQPDVKVRHNEQMLFGIPRSLLFFCAMALVLWTVPQSQAARRDVINIAGMLPPLQFRMREAATGQLVSATNFRGKVVMLYFGYTNCPDVCPDTLYKVRRIFERLGRDAGRIVFLFVTVDPHRDQLTGLKKYLALFDPRFQGLRGDPNQLYSLARRYRVVFSVHRSTDLRRYKVTHSSSICVFGPHGNARYLIARLGVTQHPNYDLIVNNLKALVNAPPKPSFFTWLAARS